MVTAEGRQGYLGVTSKQETDRNGPGKGHWFTSRFVYHRQHSGFEAALDSGFAARAANEQDTDICPDTCSGCRAHGRETIHSLHAVRHVRVRAVSQGSAGPVLARLYSPAAARKGGAAVTPHGAR